MDLVLLAPLSGLVLPLAEVPDAVFAGGTVGAGVAIEPTAGEVLAPCAARVVTVHRAGHAVTLDADGIELLIHVGIETVRLGGVGFTPLVTAGARVEAGTPLLRVDLDAVARQARSLVSPLVVTGGGAAFTPLAVGARVVAGRDAVARVQRAAGGERAVPDTPTGPTGPSADAAVWSEPIAMRDPAGLHARPAAALVAIARRFTADLRLACGDRQANLQSLVDLLALEVGEGRTVRVRASGPDADAALAAVVAALQGGAAPAQVSAPAGEFVGIAAAPGLAVGAVAVLRPDDAAVPPTRAADPAAEHHRLDDAITAATLDLDAVARRLVEQGQGDRAAIFAAHRELLADPALLDAAAAAIREGWTAAWGWSTAVRTQAERLATLRDARLAARAADVRDVGRRVLHLLTGGATPPSAVPPGAIAIAEEFTPSEVVRLVREGVRGIVAVTGGATGHAAILARGLGIPAVMGIDPTALTIAPGTRAVVDGTAGRLRLTPDAVEASRVEGAVAATQQALAAVRADAVQPATTTDGHRVAVRANIAHPDDLASTRDSGAEGIGLFRTEFALERREALPDVEEQRAWYAAVARPVSGWAPAVIRLFDVGADKPVPALTGPEEPNPALGERGVRLLLAHPEVLRTQVRAIVRAAGEGPVAILVPMIRTLEEWDAVRALVAEERIGHATASIQLGAMIETAAAALHAEAIAATADFLSIGTNDLTQFTLAIDRTHPRLAAQLDVLDPAVLALIARTVEGARRHGRSVSVCGTAAGDPEAIPVLLGLGVDAVSVEGVLVPTVKARIRTLSLAACRTTAVDALASGTAAAVRALVRARHPEVR